MGEETAEGSRGLGAAITTLPEAANLRKAQELRQTLRHEVDLGGLSCPQEHSAREVLLQVV